MNESETHTDSGSPDPDDSARPPAARAGSAGRARFTPTLPDRAAPIGSRSLSGPPTVVDLLDPEGRLSHAEHTAITDRVLEALALLRTPPHGSHDTRGEVRVRVVGDAEMAREHEARTGVVGTTDVLTFDLSESAGLDTDILVCADEADRQAARLGHDRADELLLYIIHGVLHCLGHDDHDDDAFARMHAAEDALLHDLGVGAVFARDRAPHREAHGGAP